MSNNDDKRFAELLDWVEGRLSAVDAAAMAQQVTRADSVIQADIEWIQSFLALSQNVSLATPPTSLRQNLRQRFAQRAGQRRQPGFLQRLRATLSFDSQGQMALAGVRSAAAASERMLVYHTDIADIALSILPRSNATYDLLGQIFPLQDDDLDSYGVQLLKDDCEIQLTSTDDLGEFSLDGLTQATYEMIIAGHAFELLITPLELAA